MINRKSFYDKFRMSFSKLTTKQVEGFEAFFIEWEKRGLTDLRWLAYILATVYHETAFTMQPIEEYGKGKGKSYGKRHLITGKIYYGRGHTQNTWYENYLKLKYAANKQGFKWDFVNQPELLLSMQPSVWATYHGMINGLYTGKSLSDYFGTGRDLPIQARRIINGVDRAQDIAKHHFKFLECLT